MEHNMVVMYENNVTYYCLKCLSLNNANCFTVIYKVYTSVSCLICILHLLQLY